MPFQKGNQLGKGKGRKGYEFEEEQLRKMKEILNRALVMTENIQKNEASIKQAMAYENTLRMVSKIFDKLHANKQETKLEVDGELPFQIIEIGRMKKKDDGNTTENSS